MATVLFCPVTFNLAETTRMIEVARALDPAHCAVFMGYEDDFVELITDAGFEYHAREPAWTAADREQALKLDQGKALRSPFTHELVAARVAVERRMIRDHGASAVVIGTNVTSLISARAEGVPLFYPVTFALSRPQVEQVRRFRFVDGDSRFARVADRVATSGFRWLYTRAPLAPRALAAVARENGVAGPRTIASLVDADVNLVTVMPWELDGFTLPPNYHRVGPIFAHLDGEVPAIVHELAEAPEPLVYLGLGSSASRDLALAAARQLGTMAVNVVAPIRHYLEPGDDLPANVHVTDLLPAHRLGGLIDAAVLHGGQGTVQTASATGIPFVGMGLQPEQAWNVRLCERQGHAIALSPKKVSTPAFTAAVRRLLDDPSFGEAAARVARAYAHEDGAAASARIIEATLG